MKEKSIEPALVYLVNKVGKALKGKEITMCTFFDIEGAFHNAGKDKKSYSRP